MSPLERTALFVVIVCVLGIALYKWRQSTRKSVNHGYVRSRKPDHSYAATNDIARLLSLVLNLRARNAKWPEIIATVNERDEPQIRTLLLELRAINVQSPEAALQAIEYACISAKRRDEEAPTIVVLELAKAILAKDQPNGSA